MSSTWGTPKKLSRMPVRTGARLVRAARNPQMALRMAILQVLSTVGLSFLMPLVSLAIPIIQQAMKAYIDAEIKRKLEEERKKTITEVYATLNAEDRALLRELVPE